MPIPCYVIKIMSYCHPAMYSCMSTPEAWATSWPKPMNEVITMQTHGPICGQ